MAGKNNAKKFLNKDHSDSNMLVAIRIRPMNQNEKIAKELEIIRTEDKLLVSDPNIELFKCCLVGLDCNGSC